MNKLKQFDTKIRHRYYDIAKVLAFICAAFLVFWQLPRTGKFSYEYQRSKPWLHETLYAPFDFPIYKDEAMLREENEAALKSVKPFFTYDKSVVEQSRAMLEDAFDAQWRPHEGFDKELNRAFLMDCFDSIQNRGVLAYDKTMESIEQSALVNVVRDRVAETVPFSSLFTMNSATEQIEHWLDGTQSGVDRELLATLLLNALRQNVFYDATMTRQEQEKALAMVSLTYGMVQKDELIISEGAIIDDHAYAVLTSLQREYEGSVFSFSDSVRMWLSQLFLVLVVFTMVAIYMRVLHRKDIYSELRRVNLILLLMLLMIIPSFWIMRIHPSFIYLMPVTLLTIMVVTFFTPRIAFAVQVFTLLIIGLAVPNPYQFIFMQIVASAVAILCLSNLHSRRSYFLCSLMIFCAYVVVYIAFALISSTSINMAMIGMLGLNALFTMLALPLIFLFEKLFGFTTSLTLMELSNTNSPLLRQLANTAPGTFQHSVQVANLCDEVLYAIGGNSLLARTGALYHDIGKMKNPLCFTENQHGGYNTHNDLSNRESAHVIISHVLDGIEIAHEARVPEQIIEFIRTHHGTRRTEYFYIMEQREHPDEVVDPTDFTYHGPVPFSKETAVLMICDSIEAASRSIKEPNETNLGNLVDNIIQKQMDDGQFQNVDLTMHDFTVIKKVLKRKLMSIYHVRIAYPN